MPVDGQGLSSVEAPVPQPSTSRRDGAVTLLAPNPFPEAPPKYIRAQFYDYTFAGSEERSQGRYWHRQLLGEYFPSVYFKGRDGTD